MNTSDSHRYSEQFQILRDDYESLESAEDRLAWLMERAAIHAPVAAEYCTPERRVPGCLSGLWLTSEYRDGYLYYQAKSESALVQGVVSFLCDLYSGRTSDEVVALGRSLADDLQLQGLLTLTRRRAVESTVGFFLQEALVHVQRVGNG
jgi:cysteine desulfuration protein SufE